MEEYKRTFEVEYHDMSVQDGTYDVSIELSHDAEEVLFTRLRRKMIDSHGRGLNNQTEHLYRRLCKQKESHPPWIDVEYDERTYDLEITESDYQVLSSVIGSTLSNVLNHNESEVYAELVDSWKEITREMGEDSVSEPDTESDHFLCYIRRGDVEVYDDVENRTENNRIYICTECKESLQYDAIDDHPCVGDAE